MLNNWKVAQEWEKKWWTTCHNTLGEEWKQVLYAEKMGLKMFHDGKSPFNVNLKGKSVLDIGGGPVSLLLKCMNFSDAVVIDPMPMPDWVLDRYQAAGIRFVQSKGEVFDVKVRRSFDECWIYNVLQHTEKPELVVSNAKSLSKLIRVFEWVDTVVNEGHPHALTFDKLNEWLGGEGRTEMLNGQHTCAGKCYYGIFPT